jgi:hippurate hydrolase
VFQPAEEVGDGAELMVKEGVLDRFGIREIFALHTMPGVPLGQFYTTRGAVMAAVDTFHVHITGKGGHGAYPHDALDPIPAALSIGQAMATIVSRNHYALDDLVVSVTMIHAGSADNVIPGTAYLGGTVRTFDKEVQAMVKRRMEEIVAGQAASFGVTARLDYEEGYPPTINDPEAAGFAVSVAEEIVGPDAVEGDGVKEMGAEDFAFFLEKVPGAYLFLGNGETAMVHHPEYDFDDRAAPVGASFLARAVERALPMGAERD